MSNTQDFELLRDEYIPEYGAQARLYKHVKTGAELLSIVNDDENKVFGITFRTPPTDSTGVAHILEHSVLCGSRKYPVKEPFVELLKGSLKTFLNAFTYPDKTCYPAASQNTKDFYNLVDVYVDAVLHPRLTPHVFEQEGWHHELDDPEGPLTYKGVVFNEMKGAYSSPDSILMEASQQSLFPDCTYGLDSGGDPARIPDLTYESFKDFHAGYYHPSNSRIYFYGDDDPRERLRLMSRYLDGFDRLEIDSEVRLQPVFKEPRRIERPFAASMDNGESRSGPRKGMVTVNWLLPEGAGAEFTLALHVLHYALLGMPGSPLRKALIDSGLGEDLAGVGLETELRQVFFSTGLKGIAPEDADKVEALILDTLSALADRGLDPHTIEAALNTTEFHLRENNTGRFPRGLTLMLRSLTTWLHGGDPLERLAFEAPLHAIQSNLAANPRWFEEMIRNCLLQNVHRTTVVLKPDQELGEREARTERERLERVYRSMSPSEIQRTIENTRGLRLRQQTPDSPEALATIPTLSLGDLERKNKIIPLDVMEVNGVRTLYHDIFTNGILYLDLGLDLHALPREYLPYVRLFSRSLTEMGTAKEDFVALTQRISRKTGGIHREVFTSTIRGRDESACRLLLRGKCTLSQTGELLDIFRDILLTPRFDNRERFRQMVHEEKARQEQGLIPSGHLVVNQRLRAHFSEADWAAEQIQGLSCLFFTRKLARMVDEDWGSVLRVLEEIRRLLVNRRAMILNVTVDGPGWAQWKGAVSDLLGAFPVAPCNPVPWQVDNPPENEGLTIPSQVNYVGKGFQCKDKERCAGGSTLVVTGYLRNSWLWDRVRVQGGAYGAFCILDRHSGSLTFTSYRDPNLKETLRCFDEAATFLREVRLSDSELAKAIIGTIGNLDAHLLPDARGLTSLVRQLRGDTEEDLQRMRDEVLATKQEDFHSFADLLDDLKEQGIVKVLGPQGAVEHAARETPRGLSILKVL